MYVEIGLDASCSSMYCPFSCSECFLSECLIYFEEVVDFCSASVGESSVEKLGPAGCLIKNIMANPNVFRSKIRV